jgi:multicomponent Na+:H+ antiporter subunit G
MLGGAFFMVVAALGVLRMPDLLMRMHAATKAGTLGAGMILIAVAVHYGEMGIAMRAIATVAFLFLTAPVAAHMIGRAAYFVGVRLWEGTFIDEIRGQYDERTHRLGAAPRSDWTAELPKPPEGVDR